MKYQFSEVETVGAKLMMRAITGRRRTFSWKKLTFSTVFWPLVQGGIHAAGGMAIVHHLLAPYVGSPQTFALLVSLLGCSLGLAVMKGAPRAALKWHVDDMLQSPPYLGNMTFEADEERFSIHNGSLKWIVEWNAVQQVRKFGDGICLYVGPFVYVIQVTTIPEAEKQAFWDDVLRWTSSDVEQGSKV